VEYTNGVPLHDVTVRVLFFITKTIMIVMIIDFSHHHYHYHHHHFHEGFFVYTTTHCSLKAYCMILVRRSNFRHQASPRVSPRESTQRRKVELWARNLPLFCLNADFHVAFRELLHAV
jgi:hypothetical protein